MPGPFGTAAAADLSTDEGHREALLKTGALQSAIFNSANFSIIATDATGVIQIFNIGAQRMLGYTAGDVVNQITPADLSDPRELIARATALTVELDTPITPGFEALVFKASRGIEDIYELTYIRKDRSRVLAMVSVTALRDAQDTIIGYLLIGTDNTARNQVETERKRLDQVLQEQNVELASAKSVAEKANLAKSDFLSSMSHELRSPLNAILGFAQLLESDTPPPSAEQRVSIDQILHAGWYLLELINDILDLAVIEAGRLALSLEPVLLADVMAECQDMVAPQALKHGVTTTFQQFDAELCVSADRTRLKQVLINLLSNAVKYNRPGGSVAVACIAPRAGRLRITVTDTGVGLAADLVAQLFQSFNRLGQEAGREEGTGIGLVVSKRLVELMHGDIGVTSMVGEGTVFWIELNAAAAADCRDAERETALHALLVPADAVRPATLLYVEDNPANLMLVEQLVARRSDLAFRSAGDAADGIAIARLILPDVILMDINLPGMSGVDALRILREDPSTAHIPVIALSANAMAHDVRRGLEAGFLRYLTKPIRVREFTDALAVALAVSADLHPRTVPNPEA